MATQGSLGETLSAEKTIGQWWHTQRAATLEEALNLIESTALLQPQT